MLELRQRYAGAMLGSFWIVLYPLLFLSIYLFVYLVIFRVRFPGYSQLNFVTFVFSGLIPYIALMESFSRGAIVIKENIHLIRNVIVPVELVPVRLVLVSLSGQTVSFGLLFVLAIFDSDVSWNVVFFPVVLLLAALMLVGSVYFISALGAMFADVVHIVGLLTLLFLFISPIAFKPDMVPNGFQFVLYLNPVSYLLEGFRWSILASHEPSLFKLALFPVLAIGTYIGGLKFFQRFKGFMVDHV
jgi:lipopolysaccharide transport system permease protein